jgi:DNA-binding beta-propeller fold protein YncE
MRATVIGTALSIAVVAVTPQNLFSAAHAAVSTPLELETKIPLGNVAGRIDHMAIDLARRRLFVAELGNSSVSVVDITAQKVVRRITGFKEPQGLGYLPRFEALYVASAGDGSVRILEGPDLKEDGRIDVAKDADNVRIDQAEARVFVGYGSGGLAVIDPEARRKLADIGLVGHPEAFQLESRGNRVFVNVPDARSLAVVDRTGGKSLAKWPTGRLGGNFPMALDEDRKQVIVGFRTPPQLVAFSMEDGTVVADAPTCADSDDVFVDVKRRRIYVSCGEGFVDVFTGDQGFQRIGHIPTASGARTSLFVPALDRLFLAVRARSGQPAAIWVYRPVS